MDDKEMFQPVPMPREKLAEVLDKTRWASGFDWQEMLQLAGVMKAFTVVEGQSLWSEGDVERYMCIIANGTVDVLKTDLKGNTGVITQLSVGQSLGEMSLLDKEPRSAQIVASTDLKLLVLSLDGLNTLKAMSPLVAYKFLWKLAQLLSQRLRKTSGQLFDYLCLA